MTGEFDLEAAIVAFCATETVDRELTLNARLTVNRQTDDPELTILVNEGIGGIKKRSVSLAKLAEAYAEKPEYPSDPVIVFVPAEATDPEPDLENSEPECEEIAVAGFSDIPGVSVALESRLRGAGILTYGDLEDAVDSGSIVQVPGVGGATVVKIKNYLAQKE